MKALLLIIVPFVGYLLAYRLYGRFLAERIFNLREDAPVPSKELADGQDYVPTAKGIIFGHHYTSIAGTGPIVGPAIGIIWGWLPALVWVIVGSIVMGAVHDFGALVVSLRNEGRSISEVAARYVGPRMRTVFFLIVFFELWVVIAVFCLVIAILFNRYPQSIFPVWMEIPIALALGWAIYRRGANVVVATVAAVAAMYATVLLGHWIAPGQNCLSIGTWAVILLVYASIASTLPVTTLLQPRDYINAWQLFIAMGLLLAGAVASGLFGGLEIVAPYYNPAPAGAPPIWPFLFVTIACGAISGFHSLVASGTSPKQISNERDALFVGYGSMLMEAALATLVIVAVAAGIGMHYRGEGAVMPFDEAAVTARIEAVEAAEPEATQIEVERFRAVEDGREVEKARVSPVFTGRPAWKKHYGSWGAAQGLVSKVEAVVRGSANMMTMIGVPRTLGIIIMGVFIASFAGTTLDTATRLQRYVIAEFARSWKLPLLGGRAAATGVAVVTAAGLVFITGSGGKGALQLWPMFGAVNQLLAALALLVVTVYLKRRGGAKFLVTALPCAFMLVMTLWAMITKEVEFITNPGGAYSPVRRAVLVGFNSAVLLLSGWVAVESVCAFFRAPPGEAAADASETS